MFAYNLDLSFVNRKHNVKRDSDNKLSAGRDPLSTVGTVVQIAILNETNN